MNIKLAAAVALAFMTVAPSVHADEWSAYAIDFQGGWRWSGTQESAVYAEAEAIKMCFGIGRECDVVLNVRDSCVALADTWEGDSYAYGYAQGYNRLLAEVAATAQCARQGLSGCRVVHSGCP